MKISLQWEKPTLLISGLLLTAGSLTNSTTAVASPFIENSSSYQVAQATTNLCRRVNVREGLIVREQPRAASRQRGSVGYNTQVTLVQGYKEISEPNGRLWVEIVSPVRGYVSTGFANNKTNLIMCSSAATPSPSTGSTASLCRQVDPRKAPQGLLIRADASRRSAVRGGIAANARVTLVSNYKLIPDKNGEARNWIEITAPVAGYVSANSLVMCR
ncbi:MAG: SH3 domain-containing protein [Oscillatoriaceae bacterium SKW80]|nr:SH3 domain-containing protein [Oscillatoriaceae bacterium SKYG93]MCX8121450.1 SH3 domain-containing protein [Oscillatoriaceae bacterium SKW80]MDW8452964.1 SH3 domain-containing protein [Oscillatoriaceae cyanobacterium SKYGB_i_bin93]HIK27798.1 SH3 domain-containing protein [Oscillatoriaceae cyanobacterium M7585_C2015_266]